MDTLDVRVARLEEKMSFVSSTVSDIKDDQKAQNAKLDILVSRDLERKGAVKFGRAIAAIVGSSGFVAVLAWAWEHFRGA